MHKFFFLFILYLYLYLGYLNLALTEFVLKWHHTPTFIEDGTIVPLQVLTHEEALALMQTSEWSEPMPVE